MGDRCLLVCLIASLFLFFLPSLLHLAFILSSILSLFTVQAKVHLFGHIHEQRGHWQRDDQGHYQGSHVLADFFARLKLDGEENHYILSLCG